MRGDSHHVLVTQCAPSRTHKTVMLTGPVPSPAGWGAARELRLYVPSLRLTPPGKRYGPVNIIGYLNFTRNVAP